MPLSPAVVGIPGAVPQAAGYSMSVDPTARLLYVVIMPLNPPYTSASIAQYSISTDGTLAPLATPYINVPASASGALAIDSGAQHAYLPAATSVPGGEVFQFSIGADGTLSALAPATAAATQGAIGVRSEEHTSELQSHSDIVCRLLLEKKTRVYSHCPIAVHPPQRSHGHVTV